MSQRDVEKNLNLKNPTVTGILKRLDEKGYILCVPNANDKRKKNIYLTEKAYDIQRRMESDRRKLDRELTRGMTKREVEALRRNLEKVLYNIADPGGLTDNLRKRGQTHVKRGLTPFGKIVRKRRKL